MSFIKRKGKCSEGVEKREPFHTVEGMLISTVSRRSCMKILQKQLKIELPCDPEIQVLGVSPKDVKAVC